MLFFSVEPVISFPLILLLCPCRCFKVVHKPGCIRFGFDTSILDRSSIVPCLTQVQEVSNPLKIFLWLHGSFRKNKDCKWLDPVRGWCCWSSAIFFITFFIMLESWRRTDIGMGRKDSILYSKVLDVNWYYPWIQCGIMMTISFTYRTSLSVCSWTQADMIFYKWLCKIITQSSLIAKITWFHKVSNFSAIANLAPVWTGSWVGWLCCVFVC